MSKYEPTADEVRDIIADQSHKPFAVSELFVVSIYRIVEKTLGYDPLRGKNTRTDFGGRTKDAWINEHLSMSTLRKVLDHLIDEGVVVKLTAPNFRNGNDPGMIRMHRAVNFPHQVRSGYVLLDDYNDALAAVDAKQRNNRRGKIMKEARAEIADKYAEQVQAAYRRRCAEEDLDPVREE